MTDSATAYQVSVTDAAEIQSLFTRLGELGCKTPGHAMIVSMGCVLTGQMLADAARDDWGIETKAWVYSIERNMSDLRDTACAVRRSRSRGSA